MRLVWPITRRSEVRILPPLLWISLAGTGTCVGSCFFYARLFGRECSQIVVGCMNSSGRKPSGFSLLALKPGREMGRQEREEQGGRRWK